MTEVGLLSRSEKTQEAYDRFRGRVMFPIEGVSGRVIAFGGLGPTGARRGTAEYRNPARDFPRAVTISFIIVVGVYMLVAAGVQATLDKYGAKALVRGGAADTEIADVWRTAMWGKLAGHGIDEPGFLQPDRPMSAIGG